MDLDEFNDNYPVALLDKPSKEKNSIWLDPSSGAVLLVLFSIFASAILEFPSDDQTLKYSCFLNYFSHLFNSILVYVKFKSLLKL